MKEINLVPDIKIDMIKALKVRNLVLFICLIVAAASVAVILILLGIKGGQDIAIGNKDKHIEKMSNKLGEYEELDEFLTIQDQLGKLNGISENKKVLSRVFNILDETLPKNQDRISLSELTVNLDDNVLSLEGQADAGEEPLIDYRVLESFKKNMALMKYDYGNYVDKEGNPIPAYCVNEYDDNSIRLQKDGGYYGVWYRGVKGCDPENSEDGVSFISERDTSKDEEIWRTPQFENWYKKKYITADGQISGIAHFESQCTTYSSDNDGKTWNTENEKCMLITEDGFTIDSSSNGRDANDSLVLRFEGTITLDPGVLLFNNQHLMAVNPAAQNVTDSYRQIKDMFAPPAEDCDKDDTACKNATTGKGQ